MSRIYVIAELGINHNGDVDLAKELIDMAYEADCDAVKFQKRTVDLVYTEEELNTYRKSPWGTTTRQQKEGIELSIDNFVELEQYTNSKGLDFIVSCWDLNSIDVMENNCNLKYHKVASALATDRQFLEKLNTTGKPVILSTGMCTQSEIDVAIHLLDNVEYVLACTSTYPTRVEEVNLSHITTLIDRFPFTKIGFSNHFNGFGACIGATALGAKCIEFHITKDRTMYGSDQIASIESLSELMTNIRKVEKMLGDGIKVVYDSEKPIIGKLRKVNDL